MVGFSLFDQSRLFSWMYSAIVFISIIDRNAPGSRAEVCSKLFYGVCKRRRRCDEGFERRFGLIRLLYRRGLLHSTVLDTLYYSSCFLSSVVPPIPAISGRSEEGEWVYSHGTKQEMQVAPLARLTCVDGWQ